MGKLNMDGDGVTASSAKAYTYWEQAARIGDARAMLELGKVLSQKQNNSIGWDLVNFPVATSMLQCAMKKGHRDAAVPLSDIEQNQNRRNSTPVAQIDHDAVESRRLAILQEGVKLGSRGAAGELVIHFMIRPSSDSDGPEENGLRARYYRYLENSFDKGPPERLPNLDFALPLPPARLPNWRDSENNIVGLWEAAIAPPGEANVAPGKPRGKTGR